ncbi:MAG: DNA primase catalytic subunit PriS [Methanobacteriota archaeon]
MEPWDFAQPRFRDYYQRARLPAPAEIERREFAFIFSGKKGMWRHMGFRDEAGMRRFLADRVPANSYYSTAYYKDPSGPTMDRKGWLGADLIFDLDADHIHGAEGMTFPEMLLAVKREFTKLLESFILGDFGFEPDKVEVVFSGGRGYHAHVTDERVRKLGSHERREVVDYISGKGLDFDWVMPKEPFQTKKFRGHVSVKYRRQLPARASGGWRGKLLGGMKILGDDIGAMERPAALKYLSSVEGIGAKTAEGLYAELFEGKPGSRGMDRMLSENRIEVFSDERLLNAFVKLVQQKVKVELEGEADEPVTSDIKRLIRLPGSLHAKTGFVSLPMKIDELKSFDPFTDAIPTTLTDAPVKLRGLKDASFELAGEGYTIATGKELEVPERAALFLVCSKNCEPVVAPPV